MPSTCLSGDRLVCWSQLRNCLPRSLTLLTSSRITSEITLKKSRRSKKQSGGPLFHSNTLTHHPTMYDVGQMHSTKPWNICWLGHIRHLQRISLVSTTLPTRLPVDGCLRVLTVIMVQALGPAQFQALEMM